jgi:hypothetical protein
MLVLVKIGNVLSKNSTEAEGTKTEYEIVRCTQVGGVLNSDGDGGYNSDEEKPQGSTIALDSKFMASVLKAINSVT